MPLIKLTKLEKTYYTGGVETPVLCQVSFSIEKGEFVAIMGPSGSGKSTLLHILGFLDRHTAGEYRFDGKTIDDLSPDEIAHVRNQKMGFVFQSFNLLPRTSVLDNIKLPLLYSDIPEKKWTTLASAAAKAVGLSHRLNFQPAQLSGGEKQRVAIARALINKPEVIFADEPTGNLDTKTSEQIMQLFQNLNEEKHTIVLITHEPDIAKHARRILYIRDGQLAKDEKIS
ncbi:MAG: macrolide ABC transporter ATP-binding protein [Candidatus Jacksonbacteria bacterium RIFOXYC2_FULL_44_29]|nr:MAG: ABC transporter ATP-binding protein [Parcubacteria group bacterium GW2011_GWA2_42_28]KKT55870.1 MAG: ABC transporter ATP-binding protein [Parcubacteria group bacterium GW2011_GWC2_44_22]OGY74487.1 MAG: macrolide ABC transporter ATP-binding protein [Candidatus Jacksonbacteria bacterium RIFOXYA2_FULL_43_12]OGY77396.1 MAG: macrolide ABC transporter ATP-binding protein [Candidatus Jacksonbacteria bacterium RIFOXYB2_FULL_44_15]OGY78168.1 MAG: macrolide ABC transporter ATP-binding protein [Ca